MKDKLIFIHIPKTGGTTINSAMQGTHWQTTPDFNYRHILPGTKVSNAGDIFDPEEFEKFKAYKIFMMLRDPLDRIISEYYFIRERKEFTDLLRTRPKNFEDYVRSKQTQNGVINFLKGRRMYDTKTASRRDLEDVIRAIDEIPVHVGIFEDFEKSLFYFSEISDITWKKSIEVKRMTFVRPAKQEIEPHIVELVKKCNELDYELYERAKSKFEALPDLSGNKKIEFVRDRYNHVLPYCNKWCFFEFCMENKKFIQSNFDYFKNLTFYLIRELKITDGKIYCEVWNRSFINSVQQHFPASDFLKALEEEKVWEEDPFTTTVNIAEALDAYFDRHKKEANRFYESMIFNKETVSPPPKAKGLFSKLLGR